MSGQREGFLGDILDKVKDLVTDDDRKEQNPPKDDPPLECCGQPPIQPVHGGHLIIEDEVEHDPGCPNHPDNVAKQEVAS